MYLFVIPEVGFGSEFAWFGPNRREAMVPFLLITFIVIDAAIYIKNSTGASI